MIIQLYKQQKKAQKQRKSLAYICEICPVFCVKECVFVCERVDVCVCLHECNGYTILQTTKSTKAEKEYIYVICVFV